MEEIKALCGRADIYLRTADILISEQDFPSSVSRTYYAMFYMTQATLLTVNIAVSSHSGNSQKFSELFIKTGIFPKEYGRYLAYAMEKRSKGDYEVFTTIDKEVAIDLLNIGISFVNALKSYLQSTGFLD